MAQVNKSAYNAPIKARGKPECFVDQTKEAEEKEIEETEIETMSELPENDGLKPTTTSVNSASATDTKEIIDDRLPNATGVVNEEGGSACGNGARSTSATVATTSTVGGDTEQSSGETLEPGPAEARENTMSEEEAKKIARRNWIQDQIDLAEVDIEEQRKGIEELEEARAMMEENFKEETAAIEAKEKKLWERLSEIREKYEEVEKAKDAKNEVQAQEAKEEANRS